MRFLPSARMQSGDGWLLIPQVQQGLLFNPIRAVELWGERQQFAICLITAPLYPLFTPKTRGADCRWSRRPDAHCWPSLPPASLRVLTLLFSCSAFSSFEPLLRCAADAEIESIARSEFSPRCQGAVHTPKPYPVTSTVNRSGFTGRPAVGELSFCSKPWPAIGAGDRAAEIAEQRSREPDTSRNAPTDCRSSR